MSYWDGVAAGAVNLRLFEPGTGWRQHGDKKDGDGRVTFIESNGPIDQALGTALNASNLLLLTGAGSSFCVSDPAEALRAPGMSDLWDAVEVAASPEVMGEVIQSRSSGCVTPRPRNYRDMRSDRGSE